MRKIGLALSGGGFRATLYHLGVIRLLRDANLLGQVSHITSVSGGSVIGAHLALNWDRYCGSEHEFDAAAEEVIRFIQLDVRNRIVRRYPLASLLNGARRVFRLGASRRLTRPGLLESYYQNHLFGDKCLSELPENPQLHILATNVREGSLCSFTRRGMIFQTQLADNQQSFKLVNAGLTTVPMAVAASSAFPGFFPPLELAAEDVGADEGEFPPHSFIDGGVFDNLGIRMFRWIEQSWMQKDNPLSVDDFIDIEAVANAIRTAESSGDGSPLHRIASLVANGLPNRELSEHRGESSVSSQQLVESLWGLVENHRLYEDKSFQAVRPTDPATDSLLQLTLSTGRRPDWGDHLTLNRQLLDSALQQVLGGPCFHHGDRGPDAVIVSDAGKKITSVASDKNSGLIQTAIRSSEILMNRVWQLEKETFEDMPGFIFVSSNDVVTQTEDPTALHPEVQRQVTRIRTDLDYFNDLEIGSLVQHGYCVARKTCRANPEFFGDSIPDNPPWDPTADGRSTFIPVKGGASEAVARARKLQKSSKRRIWSAMFSVSDWPTYIWLPLILMALVGGPYSYLTARRSAQLKETLLTATSQGKQIEVQVDAAVRSLQAAATFMSELPPIQGIIDSRKGPGGKDATGELIESEATWRERLEIIFQGLLRARPACLSASFIELDESGGREIVRVERFDEQSDLIHTLPKSRLALVDAEGALKEAGQLLPGNVKVFCTEITRSGPDDERFHGKRMIAAAAVHDEDNEDFFGVIVLEFDLGSVVGGLLEPASANVDAVYIVDSDGVIILGGEAKSMGQSVSTETNIANLIPQITQFLAPENRSELFSDDSSFVAIKIGLNPDDPEDMIGVVIRFTP